MATATRKQPGTRHGGQAPARSSTGLEGRAAELPIEQCIAGGIINPGWSAYGWRLELRRKAACCRTVNPQRAAELERWADAIAGG